MVFIFFDSRLIQISCKRKAELEPIISTQDSTNVFWHLRYCRFISEVVELNQF